MKLVDANVLLYAVNESDAKHDEARTWLDGALSGTETVGLAWVALLAFLRLSTKVGLFPHPLAVADALACVQAWVDQPATVILEATPRHLAIVAGLLGDAGSGANLVNDAHLAALALEHGATVVSYDRDFGRFAGLAWHLPVP
ncbi:MAG TPA: type II toxin-antitoxin system VapC family toxin [Acidimicrobiales bacterium]|nr:type II toxin-antitoxin system VapC family toxin [Acidimicrobiales bacterium]